MAISGVSGVHVSLALFTISLITFIDGAPASSVSVSEVEKEGISALSKSSSKINLSRVPVLELSKLTPRPPSKNPSLQSSSSLGGSGKPTHLNSQQQQHSPSQSQNRPQLPTAHQSFAQNQHILVPVIQTSSQWHNDDDWLSDDLTEDITEGDREFHNGFEIYATHPISSSNSIKNDTGTNGTQVNEDKLQATSGNIPLPLHVMTILNALGSGGSLAQASKPENEKNLANGYTSANAVGYATGDNATVTASVTNKVEVNPQTVIFTESATASASSLSNGTAFSQANLSSNQGGHWTVSPGSGWGGKVNKPSKEGGKLR